MNMTKEQKDLMEKYRAVLLNSGLGREVLADILTLCKFGCTMDPGNPSDVVGHNLANVILNRCGVFGENTMPQVINSFTAVMPEQEKTDD